jgi:hypothetical protein
MGIFRKTLKRHSASRRIPQQAFQLVTPMRWDLGVGMERKPVDTGTAGARQCGVFLFIPKARANAAHVLSGPLPKGEALRDGGHHGAGELGLVVTQRIIPRGHGVVDTRLQVSQPTQRDGTIVYNELSSVDDVSSGWTDSQDGGTLLTRCSGKAWLFG